MVGALDDPVKLTVMEKLHVSPLGEVQKTVVVPIGNVEPDGGLQTTPLPQLPEGVGDEYVTTALQLAVLTGATDGHVREQPEVAATTVVEADDELSARCGSFVVLDTLAVSVMIAPFAAPEST